MHVTARGDEQRGAAALRSIQPALAGFNFQPGCLRPGGAEIPRLMHRTRHAKTKVALPCDSTRAALFSFPPPSALHPQPVVWRVRKPSMVSMSSVTSNGLDAKRIGPPNGNGRRPIRS